MNLLTTASEVRDCVEQWRQDQFSVALVPTMGDLHKGHVALIEAAGQYADKVAVSLFINPLQFDRRDDFEQYSRTYQEDLDCIRACGADLAFLPDEQEMYPPDCNDILLLSDTLGKELCGHYRPGHFSGVLMIVAKLFNLFSPTVALFGEKDYQQLVLIKTMVRQLFFNIRIISVATVREQDGLALSSRNSRLNDVEREQAPILYQTLESTAVKLRAGESNFPQLAKVACRTLEDAGFRVDYYEMRDAETLQIPTEKTESLVILAAAWLGTTRLIDNVQV